MSEDEYIRGIIDRYHIPVRSRSVVAAAEDIHSIIQQWAGKFLIGVYYSGSSEKGTAISGISDTDLFISLAPETPGSLGNIYDSLANFQGLVRLNPRRQNVSIGVTHGSHSIDLVPGRKQAGNTSDHSLYRSKAGTWTQTNVEDHVRRVANSQRLDEIRALKIWRAQHGLDFPSFYLELTVIEALRGRRIGNLAGNIGVVLQYLWDDFESAVVIDPANSNNRLSDDLTAAEKSSIARAAAEALEATAWNQILW